MPVIRSDRDRLCISDNAELASRHVHVAGHLESLQPRALTCHYTTAFVIQVHLTEHRDGNMCSTSDIMQHQVTGRVSTLVAGQRKGLGVSGGTKRNNIISWPCVPKQPVHSPCKKWQPQARASVQTSMAREQLAAAWC